jgi:CheY-like chemotaxis protein
MDGLTATRAIRDLDGAAGEVPIIALTANAAMTDRDDCRAAGMTDYLSKPIDVPALYASLQRAWEEGPRVAEARRRGRAEPPLRRAAAAE